MSKEIITGSEALMRSLKNEGIKYIFGYPGGAIMPTYDALYDYTQGEKKAFEHILVRHEQGAAHAAEGYARVSGEVGVCLVTSGPGVTNTLTGVADAIMDSTPIVVIAGQVATGALGSDAFQEVDLVGITQPITKWSYQIRRPEDVAWAVSRAFYIARTGRPGPVVLDFPKDAQLHTCEWKSVKVESIRSYRPYPQIDNEAIKDAVALINASKKPFVLVGQGVELGNAQNELVAFLEKGNIPAGTTIMGLSALSSDHPLNMGMLGMHGRYSTNLKQQECDVLIAIGMRFSERVTGRVDKYAKQAKIIHLDIDNAEINKNVKTNVAVVGDCKQTLPTITALLNKADHKEWIDSFAPLNKEEEEKVIIPATQPKDNELLMAEVISRVSNATNGEAILVNDVGQNQMFSCRYFKVNKNRSVVTSGGLGTMGYGLPAAIGAKFAAPNRTVCFFTGDGGLQMSIQEFGTIMEQGLDIKIILLNNNYLGNVRQWQDMFWHKRKSFTRMINPQYDKICSGYGLGYGFVNKREDLEVKIQEMLNSKGTYILECIVKEDDNIMPMVEPGKSIDEMILEVK